MYNLEQIRTVIRDTIENRGLDYTEDDTVIDFDSLQFISMIVEFEEVLDITVGDEYLIFECFSSFANIEKTLSNILSSHMKMA